MFTDNIPRPYDSLSYHLKNVINKCYLEKNSWVIALF